MDYDESKLLHVNYGIVRGDVYEEGEVEFLEEIIDTATEVLRKVRLAGDKCLQIADVEVTALILAVSTLVVMNFAAKRIKVYEFDIEQRFQLRVELGLVLWGGIC